MTRTRTLAAAFIAALVLVAAAAASTKGTQPLARRLLDAEARRWRRSSRPGRRRRTAAASRSRQSYGASTSQAKAVVAGQPADLVFLSTGRRREPARRRRASSTRTGTSRATTASPPNTVVVFAVRDGNPKHIKGWDDLIKPGVQVVTPNPFSSGSAKWNILAAYGAQRHLGKTDAQATAYVQKLFKHVVSQDTSGSNATNTFLSGKGDVLITYESEAINARLQGKNIQYVIPRQTMLIELPIAVLQESPNKDAREQVHPVREVRRRRRRSSRSTASGRSTSRSPRSSRRRRSSRRARASSRSTTRSIGGWRTADKKSGSTRATGLMVEDRAGRRRADHWLASPSVPAARGRDRTSPRERAGTALSLGFVTTFLSVDRRAADRGARLGVDAATAAPGFWDAVSSPEAVAALEADARRSPRSPRSTNAVARDDHRLGARARRLPRQVAS